MMNERVAQREVSRKKLNHIKTRKEIEKQRILREVGGFTELLPDEYKIFATDKSYSNKLQVHMNDPSLINENLQLIKQGKDLQKKTAETIYQYQMAMFKDKEKKIKDNAKERTEAEFA